MPDQNNEPPQRPLQPPPDRPYLTTKLMIIAFLGGLALVLGCLCAVVRFQITKTQQQLMAQSNLKGGSQQSHRATKTVLNSDPTSPQHLYLSQQPHTLPNTGTSRLTAATAYWNQFLGVSPAAQGKTSTVWNPLEETSLDFRPKHQDYDLMSNRSLAEHKYYALRQAAQLGHPQAQHVYANALASGVLPLSTQADAAKNHLQVADDFFHTHNKQQQEAWLTWHMAAMSGHVESAMALAHRYETQRQRTEAYAGVNNKQKQKRGASGAGKSADAASFQCADVLPYYQAAAHGIMDKLEADPNSRTKVMPPTEKHLLYAVHLHGGTSSQLDWNNKPDESMEAIQFYHFKATRTIDPDASAAMTLGTLYHLGYRGVEQNLTMALFYYDIAAQAGSWEAAGLAGWFHVFGLGMSAHERDLYKAHKYFRQGIIGGLKGCQERMNKKKRLKAQQEEGLTLCEPGCLNGMGLLHIFGVPLVADVDIDEAMEYFALAKDMDHADAAYNLAMVTLGWKGSYVTYDDARKHQEDYTAAKARKEQRDKDAGIATAETSEEDIPEFMQQKPWSNQDGPTQLQLQHAVQYLMIAARKGHLQARHRLAMLHDTGVLSSAERSTPGRKRGNTGGSIKQKEILPADCDKALKQYQMLVEAASPHVLHRMRRAYKDYMAGDLEASLIQYMSVAELGNEIAQVNAAFLLEQGVCLGLSTTDCHKASVRYWKAAAAVGNAEACLRVGDFYYYGKLRPPQDPLTVIWDRPFGFFQYLIFPEKYWLPAFSSLIQSVIHEVVHGFVAIIDPTGQSLGSYSEDDIDEEDSMGDGTCSADGTCTAGLESEDDNTHHLTSTRMEEEEHDLSMAAHYYRIAAEKHASPRANFNLAFLHEWGLGLKQDFPLAKRHYDLAISSQMKEADLAGQIALWTLSLHEYVVRMTVAWQEYWELHAADSGTRSNAGHSSSKLSETAPRVLSNILAGKPVLGPTLDSSYSDGRPKTKADVLISHLLSLETVAIVVLTIILLMMLKKLRQRRTWQ